MGRRTQFLIGQSEGNKPQVMAGRTEGSAQLESLDAPRVAIELKFILANKASLSLCKGQRSMGRSNFDRGSGVVHDQKRGGRWASGQQAGQ